MNIDIVLVAPEIPQNTGTIGRLCVCLDARLHLIKPLGFELSATRLRRAGLDYWQHVQVAVHDDWDAFLTRAAPQRLHFASTRGERDLFGVHFAPGDFLVFGSETSGLAPSFHAQYGEHMFNIPMPGAHARSHNLANAVSIVVYEAYRQITGS
jgi:tRNA (cytidine/uridine-2'-O-)-methyltransferase